MRKGRQFTQEERSRGGHTSLGKVWSAYRLVKEQEQGDRPSTGDAFRGLGVKLLNPPALSATGALAARDREIARQYPPGVWTPDRRAWRRRLARLTGALDISVGERERIKPHDPGALTDRDASPETSPETAAQL